MSPSISLSLAEAAPDGAEAAPTDLGVVHEVIHGNREMFEVIVRRYNARLYRVGMAYLRGHAQTEDAMQNAYVKAYLQLGRFRGTSSFGTWLTRIMINECLMILRTSRRKPTESLEDAGAEVEYAAFVAPPAPDPISTADMRSLLEQALQSLPRVHRAVYLLREVQHLSTAETAQCLGLSTTNVKVCLHRAREALKTELLRTAAVAELFSYPARYCDPLTHRVMQAVRTSGQQPQVAGRP